jgi:hypothetical protein
MWGQMQTAVFHGIAYTCCTASFQPFCGMSAIRYNVLSDRAFPQVCYRTLVEYKGSGFLGISVVCGVFFIFQKVLDDRKSVIKPENFCLRLIRLKKCRAMGDIRWKKCNKVELFA